MPVSHPSLILRLLPALLSVAAPARGGQALDLIPALRLAVPVVQATGPDGGTMASGSGIVVGRDGTSVVIVTPRHVVAPPGNPAEDCARRVTVTIRGGPAPVVLESTRVRCHANLDLAVIEAKGPLDPALDLLPRLRVAPPAAGAAGFGVAVLGNPGASAATNLTGRITMNDESGPGSEELVYAAAAGSFEAGYSGGPVLTADLQLLGMHLEWAGTRGFGLRWSRIAEALTIWGVRADLVDQPSRDRSVEFTAFAVDPLEEAARLPVRRYVAALRSRDAAAVKGVWRTVPQNQLDALLGDARDITFDVFGCGALKAGKDLSGTITCKYRLVLVARTGRTQAVPRSEEQPIVFDVQSDPSSGVWILTAVR